MIILPRRSRKNRPPRQKFAGIVAAIAAIIAAGMPALTRTFRGYPRGSLSLDHNLLTWAVLVPFVILVIVGVLRFARRDEEVHHDDAGASGDPGHASDSADGSDGEEDGDRSKRMMALVMAIAITMLIAGAAFYYTAAPR